MKRPKTLGSVGTRNTVNQRQRKRALGEAGGQLTRALERRRLASAGGLAPAVRPKTDPFFGACRGASKKRPRPGAQDTGE